MSTTGKNPLSKTKPTIIQQAEPNWLHPGPIAGPLQINWSAIAAVVNNAIRTQGLVKSEIVTKDCSKLGPHLHYGDSIYLVNEQQWAHIATMIIKDCKAKLAKVNTVSFEAGIALSEAVARL